MNGGRIAAGEARIEERPEGRRRIVTRADAPHGIGLSVWTVRAPLRIAAEGETALVLLGGAARLRADDVEIEGARASLFDERPTCLLAPAKTALSVEPGPEGAELAVIEAAAAEAFAPRGFAPADVRAEQRGQGSLRDAAHREVRTIFDDETGPPGGRLVVGEVVTSPGRWSSYPPHHHAQPELYHYRFTHPEGYGHAELGEAVTKVRDGDTVVIPPGTTHAQCAAPGYGMWYLWLIPHLDGDRYRGPTFEEAHRWALEPGAPHWWPQTSQT